MFFDGAVVLCLQFHLLQFLAIRPQVLHCTTGDASRDDINGASGSWYNLAEFVKPPACRRLHGLHFHGANSQKKLEAMPCYGRKGLIMQETALVVCRILKRYVPCGLRSLWIQTVIEADIRIQLIDAVRNGCLLRQIKYMNNK